MAAVDVPFDIAEAKLETPLVRPGTVAKAELVERLAQSQAPLVSVVAPAGYGKTSLLASWAEADPRRFAWVALDGRHIDAVVFLRHVASAINRIEPVPPDVVEALSGPGGSSWARRVPRLGSALAALRVPVVLVLDDLHAVAGASCLDAVAALSEYVPPGSRIALASREEPAALPLARWRANGLVQEVGVADLQLDEQEAGLLLEAAGMDLEPAELSGLAERTEGWPAGLYLAALSMQAGAPRTAAGFSGDDRFVSDYFRSELLSRLPAEEARFLTHTSGLDRMCGGLCDAVLGTTGSAAILEDLARRNGFVLPLDRRGEWYRYHHLFGELLRGELARDEPDLVVRLNGRAMAWCIDRGQIEAAVAYGHAAGEKDRVAGLVDAGAPALYHDGRMETLEGWLGWFSDDELVRYPALAVHGAWLRVLTGRPAEAERWLELAEGAESAIALSDGSPAIEPWVANVRACMMPDGVVQALGDAHRALDGLPPQSGWRPSALLVRGVAHALVGATDAAALDFGAAIETGLVSGAADVVFVAHAELGLVAAGEGDWIEAAARARAAQALVEETGLGDYSTSAIAHVASARIALHEGRQEDARAALTRAHRLRPLLDHGIPWLTIQVGLELTRAHLALADAGAARTVLRETQRVLALRPDLGSLVTEAAELSARVQATSGSAGAWAMSLTGAELRLLPYLASYLTFPEVAGRLFISRNTVKTEAVAIYRKLGVSSRSEAIERAVEVGLLESSVYPPGPNLTPDG